MDNLIAKMRADFNLVAKVRCDAGLWGREDTAMASEAIRAAITARRQETILSWAAWLADLSRQDLAASLAQRAPLDRRDCRDCKHHAKPGKSDGYCTGRADLAKAYGKTHPCCRLPDDGAASCAHFSRRPE